MNIWSSGEQRPLDNVHFRTFLFTLDYVLKSSSMSDEFMRQTLCRTNDVLNDTDNMILTDKDGNQLVRSDEYPLVQVEHRRYYQEAMQGKEYVSDVLISLANNTLITVLEVPVLGEKGNVVGMVQRDYNLSALQDYIKTLANENTKVIITDSVGNLVAHSENLFEDALKNNQLVSLGSHPAVQAGLAGKTGTMVVKKSLTGVAKGPPMLLSYIRNDISGWVIVTGRSYSFIWQDVIKNTLIAGTVGIILLLVIALLAAFVAERATRKIRALSALKT